MSWKSRLDRPLGGVLTLLIVAGAIGAGCTVEDISDSIRVVETIPPPGSALAAHSLQRELGLGEEADAVDRGEITGVSIGVVSPESADLFSLLRIDILLSAGGESSTIASAADFTEGERTRALEVLYTDDIKPFLAADDFTIQWQVYYKTGVDFPNGGIDLETVIEFNIDIEIL